MQWQESWLSFTPRLGAIGIALSSLVVLFEPFVQPAPARVPPPVEISRRPPQPVHWDVRTGGWAIRVDGVEVSFPTASELVAAHPDTPYTVALSAFDEIILRHAAAEDFDWRMIAAVIFEESGFNPSSRSSKGAFGLMQVREIAARDVGEDFYKLPEDNIRTGVRYLSSMREEFGEAGGDTLRIALAAYNVGPAHLRDAQTVAAAMGLDPHRWSSLREVLPLLEQPSVYQRLPYGYARGSETVRYVGRVWDRFREYQRATATFANTSEPVVGVGPDLRG